MARAVCVVFWRNIQTLAHNPCPMLVAQTVGDQNSAYSFFADSMLRGLGVLFRVNHTCMLVTTEKDRKTYTLLLKKTKLTANENL